MSDPRRVPDASERDELRQQERGEPTLKNAAAPLRFGRFEIQPLERRLLVDGEAAVLGARAFDLLLALSARPGELLSKHQLLDAVWPDVVVEENNLQVQVSALRKLLGGDVIVTIPGRGYRFAARGGADTAASPAASAAESTSTAAAPPPEAPRLQTNLPATLPNLVGRGEDLAALNELIDQHRLVSIIGAGGMGKTTVALHLTAGRQAAYRHGVCWVELATVSDPEALPGAIAAAIGVNTGSGEPLAGLCGALMPLNMLVVLDNAEQVLDGVARVVQAVLDKAPGIRFVVTTQAPLKLAAERAYRIGALSVPQGPLPAAHAMEFGAVALFVERARAADAGFVLTDANAAPVIDLCRQLDGVALAIELAAARAPMLGVQRLASSMGDRLKLLTSGRNRIAPARQQTLRAALEWSHGFLNEAEQAVFRRLSVFAGSGSLSMVQQVVADPPGEGELDEWAVLDALALLVDRSLVVAITPDDASEPRYRLLDTPRLFAREKLQQAGEEAALRMRHAHAVARLFDAAYDEYLIGTVGPDAWHQSIVPDLDNGREALGWIRTTGDAVRVLQIAATLSRCLSRGNNRERSGVVDLIVLLIERIGSVDLLARICKCVATLSDNQPHRARALAHRCIERMSGASEDDPAATRYAHHSALVSLAIAECACGNADSAEAAMVKARALFDPTWPWLRRADILYAELALAQCRGDSTAVLQWARRGSALSVANGDSFGKSLSNLVDAELAAGNAAQAAATGEAAVAAMIGRRDERTLSYGRLNLSAALLALGQQDRARGHMRAGWAQAPLFDLQPYFADYLSLLAALDGRFAAAAKLAGYADAANARVSDREPNEAAAIARAVQLARAALEDAEFDRLHAEGAVLRDADIEALAFATQDSA